MDKKGKLFIIAGPSGVGKGTIVKEILSANPDIELSVSATTRAPREGEIEGVSYYFLTKEDFRKKIENNELIEWAEFAGNYYGTLKSTVDKALNEGQNLILEIEVQGALQVKQVFPDVKMIFILPPDIEELKSRLINRNTETQEALDLRLAQVDRELKISKIFDVRLINDDLNKAVEDVTNFIKNN
ncbi:MAG: guanylate kinase [Candidatus Gastranaerophilales bacterium]|nr:guanylate kinase [Candidatus Gastranaerophilales bacterium]